MYNNIEYILRRNEEDVRNEFYIISYHNIFVGIISLTNRSKDDEQFEIDIGILPEYRKKGIAEKVSNIFIDKGLRYLIEMVQLSYIRRVEKK